MTTERIEHRQTLAGWITREAIPFSLDLTEEFNAAVDRMMAQAGDVVTLLGLGEPLHGGEEFLVLRNRLFQRLVEAHGYRVIALESSFPRGLLVDAYVAGQGPAAFEEVAENGFSHEFGKLKANRELVEWMRQHNATAAPGGELRFAGFDSPTEYGGTDSPRQCLELALDSFSEIDDAAAAAYRERIAPLLGEDDAWENPAAMLDPAQARGLSPEAAALRLETEELLTELQVRRPELVARSDEGRHLEALRLARMARHLLTYHAALARDTPDRWPRLLGIRDVMMADTLAFLVDRERGRGKVLTFAHNSHLQRGMAEWHLGPDLLTWWPAGAHVASMLGQRYAVIGAGLGVSEANGIGQPQRGTLEALLTAAPGPGRFIPTHGGDGLEVTELPVRSGSSRNPSYFPLTARSLRDFDWLVVLDQVTYWRGGPPLPE